MLDYTKKLQILLCALVLGGAPARCAPAPAHAVHAARAAADYFAHKRVPHLVYLACDPRPENKHLSKHLMTSVGMRVAVRTMDRGFDDLKKLLQQWTTPVGVLLDGSCDNTQLALDKASRGRLFDAAHSWLLVAGPGGAPARDLDHSFQHLDLSVDADILVASSDGDGFKLTDVFNFGKIQGNNLETNVVGTWRRDAGLNITLNPFKYYDRWDFHNLTLRAVTVILDRPKVFHPEMVSGVGYTQGISAMTKVAAQLLDVLKYQHNFRFNYTIADRWVGEPQRNSTLAVTNSLYWGEQDLSYTSMRIFPKWIQWVDPFFPPAAHQETKFFYLMLDHGAGAYENRFLQPLSGGAWAGAGAAAALAALALGAAAAAERRPSPALHALGTVHAAVCQQAYEDGAQLLETTFSSQGRRLATVAAGLCGMLVYNYYTSSVVSWLLSAPPPALRSLDALLASRLQLVFEDIGYTRGWLDNPGFYYYSGFKNPKEDELRDRKVTRAKRTVPVLQSVEEGVELVRTGEYAYHSEPYTAGRVLARRLGERELCQLAALQMMPPAHTYIVGQRRGPYKQFFDWSLLRLLERGHRRAARARVAAAPLACSGREPRALALGQAAPAFALLAHAALLALLALSAETLCHRVWSNRRQ